jgi:hypothetical protein
MIDGPAFQEAIALLSEDTDAWAVVPPGILIGLIFGTNTRFININRNGNISAPHSAHGVFASNSVFNRQYLPAVGLDARFQLSS